MYFSVKAVARVNMKKNIFYLIDNILVKTIITQKLE